MKRKLSLAFLALVAIGSLIITFGTATATEVCHCIQRTTATYTKVGATCLNARTKARDAARAAAVCDADTTACGPVSHTISTCTPLATGGYSASAYATYYCEFCFDKPDIPELP